MKVSKYTIGNKTYSKTCVYKDNLIFGVRLRKEEEENPALQVKSEMYLEFENGVKLNINIHKEQRRVAKQILEPEEHESQANVS